MKRIFGIRVRGIRIRIRRENKVWFGLFFVSGLDLCQAEIAYLFCFPRCFGIGSLDNGSFVVGPVYLGEFAMRCSVRIY